MDKISENSPNIEHYIEKKPDEFIKLDTGKLDWTLLDFDALEEVVKVAMFGEKKYSRDNWKLCKEPDRYDKALMRHAIEHVKGNVLDVETEIYHLAHAAWNCMARIHFLKKGVE